MRVFRACQHARRGRESASRGGTFRQAIMQVHHQSARARSGVRPGRRSGVRIRRRLTIIQLGFRSGSWVMLTNAAARGGPRPFGRRPRKRVAPGRADRRTARGFIGSHGRQRAKLSASGGRFVLSVPQRPKSKSASVWRSLWLSRRSQGDCVTLSALMREVSASQPLDRVCCRTGA